MTNANRKLLLPWSRIPFLKNKIAKNNNRHVDFWKRNLRILSEAKNIRTSESLAEFMFSLLNRNQRDTTMFGFHALKAALGRLEESRRNLFLREVVPWMTDIVREYPQSLNDIALLTQGENRSVQLSQHEVCTLLACSFFSLFPQPIKFEHHFWFSQDGVRSPNPNMAMMLSLDPTPSQTSKATALLLYFIASYQNKSSLDSTQITFSRRSYDSFPAFNESANAIQSCSFTSEFIEDQSTALQVIFANKLIGGGVFGYGCVQEEIRLIVSPELLVARILCEELKENEAAFCVGAQQYVRYKGYAKHFQVIDEIVLGHRKPAAVVWIDALHFSKNDTEQFFKEKKDRELRKAFVGFSGLLGTQPIATGNWGCGAFNGDPQLKFLIQLCAASEAGRTLIYSNFEQNKEIFEKLVTYLRENNMRTVADLYKFISKIHEQ